MKPLEFPAYNYVCTVVLALGVSYYHIVILEYFKFVSCVTPGCDVFCSGDVFKGIVNQYVCITGAVAIAPKAEDIRFKTKPDGYVRPALKYSFTLFFNKYNLCRYLLCSPLNSAMAWIVVQALN